MSAHLSEWTLRRLHAGELPHAESQQARAHVTACAECHGVLKGMESSQARFEAEVPFERFAAGVERAMTDETAEPSRPRLNGFLVAVAATVFLAMLVRPLLLEEHPTHRLEGGAWAELRIGGEGPQRAVVPGDSDTLLPGEQVQLGYVAGPYRYLLAMSVDGAGEVSVLYSEGGMSRPVEPGAGRHWLPDSLAFTGSGNERVVVVLSHKPLLVESVRAVASRAWEAARGNVAAMSSLGVDGEEIHWLLQKQ